MTLKEFADIEAKKLADWIDKCTIAELAGEPMPDLTIFADVVEMNYEEAQNQTTA